jgi:nicotinate-nucleotide--dimethylbenzimidazole phosphoribosyltransferase
MSESRGIDLNRLIEETCNSVEPLDERTLSAARERQLTLTKPPGSLGRLEEIGNRLAAITGSLTPRIAKKRILVAAADHGVTEEGVSAYPREVTHQMVMNFLSQGAAINVLARFGGIDVQVVDAGVDHHFSPHERLVDRKIVRGTDNFARGHAMKIGEAEQCIAAGIELAIQAKLDGIDLFGLGEMGIGNTTSASAITSVLTGLAPEDVTGRGTGMDDAGLKRKVAVIEQALRLHLPSKADPVEVLAMVGGAEIGLMMGAVIGGASRKLPVVADGFISTAAAALACARCPRVRGYLFIAHLSEERGHRALIDYIGIDPILDLGLRLGEGTGAALAMHVIEASARILSEMATFDGAGVSNRES